MDGGVRADHNDRPAVTGGAVAAPGGSNGEDFLERSGAKMGSRWWLRSSWQRDWATKRESVGEPEDLVFPWIRE